MNRLDAQILAAVVASVAAAGCSSGIDLTGTYQVTVHTADAAGCTTLVPVTDPPFIRFEKDELLGHSYFSITACDDPAQVDCPGAGLYGLFSQSISDGWRAEIGISQTGGGCVLDYNRADAVLIDDTHVVVDGNHYHDETDRPEAECTPDTAIELGDSMPCAGAEHIEATLVSPT